MGGSHHPGTVRPRFGDVMMDLSESKEANLCLASLHSIASESVDAEAVRIALVALYSTEMGRVYLTAHPIGF